MKMTSKTFESSKELQSVAQIVSDALIIADRHGEIHFWNHAAEKIFGYSARDMTGGNLLRIIPVDLRKAHEGTFGQVLRTAKSYSGGKRTEIFGFRKDGSVIPLEMSLSSFRSDQDIYFTAVLRDISEEKHRAAFEGDTAQKAKKEFLSNISHELRTPMNGIIGMLDLALSANPTPEQREYLDLAKVSADSLLSIINDLLDFSAIESGRMELVREKFNLREMVEKVVNDIGMRENKSQLEITITISPEVPDHGIGDPKKLRQVIQNLVRNSLKFTEKGEVMVRVENLGRIESLFSEEAQNVLKFSVKDTGIGIPVDKAALLFESFTQLDTSTTKRFKGAGLGLAISKQLVEAMGGSIGVESNEGEGSTFYFTILLPEAESSHGAG